MAALDDLISRIPDESLRERIRAEMKRANRQKKFGLVFEEHLPEATPLYDIPVKRGSVVATKDGQVTDIYYVEKIEDGQAACFHKATKERVVLPVDALAWPNSVSPSIPICSRWIASAMRRTATCGTR